MTTMQENLRRLFHFMNVQAVDKIYDFDGNEYNSVTLCGLKWLTEPLKTTHYMNGDIISPWLPAPDLNNTGRIQEGIGVEDSLYPPYYNYLAYTDPRKLLPDGWRLPTFDEVIGMLSCRYPALEPALLTGWTLDPPGDVPLALTIDLTILDPVGSPVPSIVTLTYTSDNGNNNSYTTTPGDLDYYEEIIRDLMSTRQDPTEHPRWDANTNGTNSSGLNFLPKGNFDPFNINGIYIDTGYIGYFWLGGGGAGYIYQTGMEIYDGAAPSTPTLFDQNLNCQYLMFVKDV